MPIDFIVLSAAFITGLLGGVHCAVMCGGIAAGIATQAKTGPSFAFALQSNLGRIAGYSVAGAIVGGFGSALLSLARLQSLQQGLRLFIGLILILAATRLVDRSDRLRFLTRPGLALWKHIAPLQRTIVPASGLLRPWLLGLFWGWLPCGLSVTMLAAAWLEASALHGGLLMLSFGIGTLPLMTALTWSGTGISKYLARPRWRYGFAGLIAGAGIITILAPWLAKLPALHYVLAALGCRSLG